MKLLTLLCFCFTAVLAAPWSEQSQQQQQQNRRRLQSLSVRVVEDNDDKNEYDDGRSHKYSRGVLHKRYHDRRDRDNLYNYKRELERSDDDRRNRDKYDDRRDQDDDRREYDRYDDRREQDNDRRDHDRYDDRREQDDDRRDQDRYDDRREQDDDRRDHDRYDDRREQDDDRRDHDRYDDRQDRYSHDRHEDDRHDHDRHEDDRYDQVRSDQDRHEYDRHDYERSDQDKRDHDMLDQIKLELEKPKRQGDREEVKLVEVHQGEKLKKNMVDDREDDVEKEIALRTSNLDALAKRMDMIAAQYGGRGTVRVIYVPPKGRASSSIVRNLGSLNFKYIPVVTPEVTLTKLVPGNYNPYLTAPLSPLVRRPVYQDHHPIDDLYIA